MTTRVLGWVNGLRARYVFLVLLGLLILSEALRLREPAYRMRVKGWIEGFRVRRLAGDLAEKGIIEKCQEWPLQRLGYHLAAAQQKKYLFITDVGAVSEAFAATARQDVSEVTVIVFTSENEDLEREIYSEAGDEGLNIKEIKWLPQYYRDWMRY